MIWININIYMKNIKNNHIFLKKIIKNYKLRSKILINKFWINNKYQMNYRAWKKHKVDLKLRMINILINHKKIKRKNHKIKIIVKIIRHVKIIKLKK